MYLILSFIKKASWFIIIKLLGIIPSLYIERPYTRVFGNPSIIKFYFAEAKLSISFLTSSIII